MSFTGLLTIVFIILKLTGFIAWSWWWVVSPAIVGVLLVAIGAIIASIVAHRKC